MYAQRTPGGVQKQCTELTGFCIASGFRSPSGAWIWSLLRGKEEGGDPNVSLGHPGPAQILQIRRFGGREGIASRLPWKQESLRMDAGELGALVGTVGFLTLRSFVMGLCILLSADGVCSLFGPRQQTHSTAPVEGKALHPPVCHLARSSGCGGRGERGTVRELRGWIREVRPG